MRQPALDDNHVEWNYPAAPPPGYGPGKGYGIGIETVPTAGRASRAPQEAVPPLYISSVVGGPAAEAGLRPGDIIESVNGASPFTAGVISPGVFDLLFQPYPQRQPLRLTLHRPATGRTWTVTLQPVVYTLAPGAAAVVTSRLPDGDVAYVKLAAFAPGSADQVLSAISRLHKDRQHPAAAPALGGAHKPRLCLGMRRVQRRGQGPSPGHPGRH
jgi:carboxyl-terminal processing protease